MKKIVIIGANDFQNQLILKAKEMGFETHVFAWQDGSIGERTADHFYPVSIVEIDEILEKCREIKPDAVATIASDLANITVSKVAAGLGLPGNTPECIELSTNKYAMRSAFLKAGCSAWPTKKKGCLSGESGEASLLLFLYGRLSGVLPVVPVVFPQGLVQGTLRIQYFPSDGGIGYGSFVT